MSMTDVRPYFRARMSTLNYTEWTDVFNTDNIPKALLNTRYHIETLTATGERRDQYDQEITMPVTITFHVNGCRDVSDGIDSAISKVENIVKEVVKPSNNNTQTGIKNVLFRNSNFEPISASNDNIIRASIEFDAFLIIDPS